MEYQPKHAKDEKKKKRVVVAAFLIGGLALTAGGVYASGSITINGDNKIEFGQGAATTQTCDNSMTSALSQSWYQSGPYFKVDSVDVGYDEGVCDGKDVIVSLLDASGNAVCGVNAYRYAVAASSSSVGFSITVSTTCDASLVERVLITTSNHVEL